MKEGGGWAQLTRDKLLDTVASPDLGLAVHLVAELPRACLVAFSGCHVLLTCVGGRGERK